MLQGYTMQQSPGQAVKCLLLVSIKVLYLIFWHELELKSDGTWKPFLEYMKLQYKESTRRQYIPRVEKFLSQFSISSPGQLEKLTPSDLMGFISNLEGDRHLYSSAIIAFLEFYGMGSIASKIPTPRGYAAKAPQWLPDPVIRQVLVDKRSPDLRLAALSAISEDLALRANEALMLSVGPASPDTAWIDLKSGEANIYREKTRAFPWQRHKVSDWAMKHLLAYANSAGLETGDPLFLAKKAEYKAKKRMNYQGLVSDYHNWFRGLEYDATHRIFRSSKATWMAIEGHDVIDIMRFLGHSNVLSTSIYLHIGSTFRNDPLRSIESLKQTKIYEEAKEVISGIKI